MLEGELETELSRFGRFVSSHPARSKQATTPHAAGTVCTRHVIHTPSTCTSRMRTEAWVLDAEMLDAGIHYMRRAMVGAPRTHKALDLGELFGDDRQVRWGAQPGARRLQP